MKSPRKPKCCQWLSGICSRNHSTWATCKNKPILRVWTERPHVCVGWVCAEHALVVLEKRMGQMN